MCYKLSRSPLPSSTFFADTLRPSSQLSGARPAGGKGRMAPRGRQVTCYGAAVLLAAALLLSAPDATGSTCSLSPPPHSRVSSCLNRGNGIRLTGGVEWHEARGGAAA